MRLIHIITLTFAATFLFSCQPNTLDNKNISVTIIPQKFFVHQIIGDTVTVNVMVPPGGSPATYEPTPQQMKSLSHSALYFSAGHLGFEKAWMDKLASVNPSMKIINTSDGLQLMADEEFEIHGDHVHAQNHDHSHEGYNPHIWLSPNMVKHQATIMYNQLAILYPAKQKIMQANLNQFLLQCDSTYNVLNTKFESLKGESFIVYHPIWTYLANDLGLTQISIEHNGKEATADKLKMIIDFAKANNIHTLFVQQEFSDAQAKTIANEINGKVIPLNPLAYDWFSIMKTFEEAFIEQFN